MRLRRARRLVAAAAMIGTLVPVGSAAAGIEGLDVLDGVACPSSSMCMAVGAEGPPSTPAPLAETREGSTWEVAAVPEPPTTIAAELSGVACGSTTSCVAVGSYTTPNAEHALIETWNGTVWKVATAAEPTSGTQFDLAAVSCLTAGACLAVGSYADKAGTTVALAESSTGSTWSLQTPVDPAKSKATLLQSVACVTEGCFAIGYWYPAAGSDTLAELWNGSSWVVEKVPTGADQYSEGLGVACFSGAACLAVGASGGTPVASAWNGAKWSDQSPPALKNAGFTATACHSATSCLAVGTGDGIYLAETFNGSRWTAHNGKIPAQSEPGQFTSVACSSADQCTAVGGVVPKSPTTFSETTLAETLTGSTWAVQKTPDPR